MRDYLLSEEYRYDTREEKNRILRLQRMLRILSHAGSAPSLNTAETGEYDTRTREAIRTLQSSYGLPVTGITDLATWNLLREQMEKYTPPTPVPVQLFPSSRPEIEEGEYSDTVLHMQLLLNALRLYYDSIPPIPLSGYYDGVTADAVRAFRRVQRLPEEGSADSDFLRRLTQEYNRIGQENQ